MLDKNDIHKMAVEAGLYTAPISLGPWNDKIQAFAQKLLAAQLAAPVLTECRHCGFRVALNEAPQGASK